MKLADAHRVVYRGASGVTVYWYAWRGGPRIGAFKGATLADAERAEAAGSGPLAEAYAATRRTATSTDVVAGLVAAYKASPEYAKLADSTRKQWSRWLDRITEDLGTFPVIALKAKGAKRQVIAWRNKWADKPRAADMAVQVAGRLFSWSMKNELAEANPAAGIEQLYDAERAGEIVEPGEFAAILAKATPAAARFFRISATTGLRLSDVRRLKWSDVTEHSVELATGKSRGRRRIIVPVTEELRAALEDCRRAEAERIAGLRARSVAAMPSPYVAVTAKGTPWSPQAPSDAWADARPAGCTKHLHDLRGNFATLLIGYGFSDEQIADVLGWEPGDVTKIRRRYVDRDRVALAMVERMKRAQRNGSGTPL